MKKSRMLLALLMAILVLAGSFTMSPAVAADDSAPVVYSWDSSISTTPEAWTAWQNWAKQYYPDIVNFIAPKSAGNWGSFTNKIVLSSTTKERWDAVPSGVARFSNEWSEAGVVRPVEELLDKANATNLKKMIAANPDWKNSWTYKGKLWGIPYGGKPVQDTHAWVWRSDVLKKCGFTSVPKTIAQLEAFCAAVKKNYPKMVPLGLTFSQLTIAVEYPIAGVVGWYTKLKNGQTVGIRFAESFQWPIMQEIHKFYVKGWLSNDIQVAYAKTGTRGQRQDFLAGKVAVTRVNIGDAKLWGDTIIQIKSTHPSWNPIVVKDMFSGPKGVGRRNEPVFANEMAVMFAAKGIGNEAAQIRLG